MAAWPPAATAKSATKRNYITENGGDPAAPALSIVVPVHNEAGGLDAFFERLLAVLDRMGQAYEVVCVDDGSTDASWAILLGWHARVPAVRLIALSRNFGKDVALAAGLDAVRGAATVLIDADLQHPPELIETLYAKWRAGYDMVYAQRRDRQADGFLRRNAAHAFYWLFARIADIDMPEGAGDFRLLDRKVVEALKAMPERARFMKGLYAWVGFRHIGVPFDPAPRVAGSSAWRMGGLMRFAVDGLVSFSTLPLTLCAYLGALIALPSMALGLYFVFKTLILGVDVPGYASIFVAVTGLGGLQLFTMGVFGAYLGRLYQEAKRRPLYVVRQTEGFESAGFEQPEARPSRPVLPLKARPATGRAAASRRAAGPLGVPGAAQ